MPGCIHCLLPILLIAAPSAALVQEIVLIERSAYTFPAWDDAAARTDVEDLYATRDEYVAAATDEQFVLEKLRYRSDGLAVIAYLYRSADGSTHPVIVFNRGSFVRNDIAPELLPMFHRLASAGFTVVAPMYRGSDGGEGRDELGGADLADLMNVTPLLRELPSADTKNVFLYGESRGGMMVFQAIRDGFPARAAATFGAFADLEEMASTEQGRAMAEAVWPEFPAEKARIIERRSALAWPDKLRVPLLLMHGGSDRTVSPEQTLLLAIKLVREGTDFGVIVYPGGDHVLTTHRKDRDQSAVEHFRRYLSR